MSTEHEIVPVDNATPLRIRVEDVSRMFLVSPYLELVQDPETAQDVFGQLFEACAGEFWQEYSQKHADFELMSVYTSSVRGNTDEDGVEVLMAVKSALEEGGAS